jgi:hypothetical protein
MIRFGTDVDRTLAHIPVNANCTLSMLHRIGCEWMLGPSSPPLAEQVECHDGAPVLLRVMIYIVIRCNAMANNVSPETPTAIVLARFPSARQDGYPDSAPHLLSSHLMGSW